MTAKTIREQHESISGIFQSLSSNPCFSSPNDECDAQVGCDREDCAGQIRQTFAALMWSCLNHFETEREAMRGFSSTEFADRHNQLHADLLKELLLFFDRMGKTERLVEHIDHIKRFELHYLHHNNTNDIAMLNYLPA